MSSISRQSAVCILTLFCLACGSPKQPFTPLEVSSVEDGEQLIEQERFDEARQVFEKVLGSDPENARAHYYLGFLAANAGDSEAAAGHYRDALELNGELMVARNNLGILYLEAGDPAAARSEFEAVVEKNPEDGDAWYNLGLSLESQNDPQGAKTAWERAAAVNSADAAPVLAIADLEKKSGQLDAALNLYRKARQIDPENPMAALQEGQLLLEMKKIDEARAMLLSLRDYPSAEPLILTSAGFLLSRADRDADAVELYRTAIVRDENYAKAHFMLANALGRLKNCSEASLHFEKFIALVPAGAETEAARKGLAACRGR